MADEATLRALKELGESCDPIAIFAKLIDLHNTSQLTAEALIVVENELQHCGLHHHSPSPSAPFGSLQWKRQIADLKAKKQTIITLAAIRLGQIAADQALVDADAEAAGLGSSHG